MKNVLEYGKRVLISVVAALAILAVVIILIEWKNLMNPMFTCVVCKEEVWGFPRRVTILGQEVNICKSCLHTLKELGQGIKSMFG